MAKMGKILQAGVDAKLKRILRIVFKYSILNCFYFRILYLTEPEIGPDTHLRHLADKIDKSNTLLYLLALSFCKILSPRLRLFTSKQFLS